MDDGGGGAQFSGASSAGAPIRMGFCDLLNLFRLFTKPHSSLPSGMTPSNRLKFCVVFWPDVLTAYIMSVMITYLTGVWELSLTHAALIVNVYSGMVLIMPVAIKLIVDSSVCHWMLSLSRLAFIAGFVTLTMSTPPVFSWLTTGTCSSYEAQCIGQVQKNLFYAALSLLAFGVAAQVSSLDHLPPSPSSESDQRLLASKQHPLITNKEPDNDISSCEVFTGLMLMFVIPIAALIAISYISSWWIKFVIAGICTVASTIIFLSGLYSYQNSIENHQGSRLTEIFQNRNAKIALAVYVPPSMLYVVLGVIYSIGNTYFIEQATDMNHYVGSLYVPVLFLPMFKDLTRVIWRMSIKEAARIPHVGFANSLTVATLCCITAAKVETRRLGLIDETSTESSTIAMTMFWLVPQFLLLGLTEAIVEQSIAGLLAMHLVDELDHRDDEATKASKRKYKENIAQAVNGVGILCGVLLVYVVGKIKPSWFQDTLNTSRFDNYYWTLSAFSAVCLPLYIIVLNLLACCLDVED